MLGYVGKTIEIEIHKINMHSGVPAIEAINKYMLGLGYDFPIKQFFSEKSIQELVALDPIRLVKMHDGLGYDCLSGVRALHILKEYAFPKVTAIEVQTKEADRVEDLVKLAITTNILPLCYWPVALGNNSRAFNFINGMRGVLPQKYRRLIPSASKLRQKLGLKQGHGRVDLSAKSELEKLVQDLKGRT